MADVTHIIAMDLVLYNKTRRDFIRKTVVNRHRRRQRMCALFLNMLLLNTALTVERTTWVAPRPQNWWEKLQWKESDWTENLRMTHYSYLCLCELLEPHIIKRNTTMRRAVCVRKRVAIALWRLGTLVEYRTIAHLFGVGRSTVHSITREFCTAVCRHLRPLYLNFPSTVEEAQDIIDGFYSKWGFPQVIGCLDGTHISIDRPEGPQSGSYYNQKGFYSIVMQALVDHKGIFRDVYLGWAGSVHDARVFANSGLFRKAEEGALFPPVPAKSIEGCNIPLLILTDPAYPLLDWTQKPYSDNGRLTDAQRHFNFKLSQTRMAVEMAFGRLKQRWRCLQHRNEHSIKGVCRVVLTCVLLHNFCERAGEIVPSEDDLTRTLQQNHNEDELDVHNEAHNIRDALTRYFQVSRSISLFKLNLCTFSILRFNYKLTFK